jgi:hypothetical protein
MIANPTARPQASEPPIEIFAGARRTVTQIEEAK